MCWCAFHFRNPATCLQEAHTNSIFSLAISVLEYYTVRNVMLCFSTVLSKTELRIRFQYRLAIFSDFIRLFELLGPGFTPYGSNAFYILE